MKRLRQCVLIASCLPLCWLAMMAVARNPAAFLARFFTGFCFVTNGVYIFAGAFARVGDAEVLRREGAPLWGLVLFGALTTATGLVLWHRQGIHFGLGKRNGQVNGLATFLSASLLVAFLVVELLLGSSS